MRLCRYWQTAPHGCGLSAASGCTFCKEQTRMSEYTIYESAVKQCNGLQDQLARMRAGLRQLKAEAAAQSLHDGNGNSARAAFARFEGAIEQLLAQE